MSRQFCETYGKNMRTELMLKAILLTDSQIEKYGEYMTDIEELSIGERTQTGGTAMRFTDVDMANDAAKLRQTSAKEFTVDNNGFTARVERDKKSLVFFSVPYDKGWSATVNGKPVTVEKVNVGFMAVAVDEGESEIRFRYQNSGLVLGIAITLVSIFVFVVYMMISYLYTRHKVVDVEYPEGERLLSEWIEDDKLDEAMQTQTEENQSLLDLLDQETIVPNQEYEGGFIINQDIFEKEKNDETEI